MDVSIVPLRRKVTEDAVLFAAVAVILVGVSIWLMWGMVRVIAQVADGRHREVIDAFPVTRLLAAGVALIVICGCIRLAIGAVTRSVAVWRWRSLRLDRGGSVWRLHYMGEDRVLGRVIAVRRIGGPRSAEFSLCIQGDGGQESQYVLYSTWLSAGETTLLEQMRSENGTWCAGRSR